jgi:hypothetical protein
MIFAPLRAQLGRDVDRLVCYQSAAGDIGLLTRNVEPHTAPAPGIGRCNETSDH